MSTPCGGAELTFDWYIENDFDSGEYLALDLFDGDSWIEIARLSGNVDQENTWHTETIPIDGAYLVDDFQTVTYALNDDANGVDTFTYTVSDGNGGFDSGNVTVTVNAVNHAPV